MAQRSIFIDDTDPSVKYVGQWFLDSGSQDGVGFSGPTHNHTLHGITTSGSLSFSFQGSSISVLGTTGNLGDPSKGWKPPYECFVDNTDISWTVGARNSNNQVLCYAKLNDAKHQLTINVTSATSLAQPFWFDGFRYAPSDLPTVSEPTAQVIIENNDTAIVYNDEWNRSRPDVYMSLVNGSHCSLNFTGINLMWFGLTPSGYPHLPSMATYSIDDGDPVPFRLAGRSGGSNSTLYNQLFFSTPQLSPGPHRLLVTHRGNNLQTPLSIDYILVTNTSSPVSNGIPTSASTSTSTGSHTTAPSNSSISASANTNALDGAAIGGGIVGGVIFLTVVAFIVSKFMQKRRIVALPSAVDKYTHPLPEPRRHPPTNVLHDGEGLRFSQDHEMPPLPPAYRNVH